MENAMIFGKIAQAMSKVGAIGKDSTATNQNGKKMYSFRGIDAVYNALNPVMSELGLFICPEVLEQTREERKSSSGAALIYSILKIKFTMYASDGSSVSCVTIGEGMDSGDKASNKAMSVALKYAMFQLFMIPTEEMMDDPDAETHEVMPRQTAPAKVETVASVPDSAKLQGNVILEYFATQREGLRSARGITKAENAALWNKQVSVLRDAGLIPNKALSTFTREEAQKLITFMYERFKPTGTELIPDDGKAS